MMKEKKKQNKSLFGRINAWLHLWLGIFAGVILVFVALTGTLIVYCDEILNMTAGDAKYIQVEQKEKLPAEKLMSIVMHSGPKGKPTMVSDIAVFKDSNRSVRFRCFDRPGGLSYVYVNPYSGKILKKDTAANFFYIVAHLHAAFMVHGAGSWIVDIATIIFLIELISGIILWWPKKWNKHTRDASFKIKWKAKFKRVNYDLHNVLGFYASILGLTLTITGLIIAFQPVSKATAKLFGGNADKPIQKILPKADKDSLKKVQPINIVFAHEFALHPEKNVVQMYTFKLKEAGTYYMTVANRMGLKSAESPIISVVDKYTGKPLTINDKILKGQYIDNNVWQLHMGTWMGQLGKLCTFLCGLICTSLPITGFLVWIGKKKKKSSKKQINLAKS